MCPCCPVCCLASSTVKHPHANAYVLLQDEKMLLEQLTQAFEKGSWLVFSDPDKPMYHKSLQEFQQHVRQSYLVSAAVTGFSGILSVDQFACKF